MRLDSRPDGAGGKSGHHNHTPRPFSICKIRKAVVSLLNGYWLNLHRSSLSPEFRWPGRRTSETPSRRAGTATIPHSKKTPQFLTFLYREDPPGYLGFWTSQGILTRWIDPSSQGGAAYAGAPRRTSPFRSKTTSGTVRCRGHLMKWRASDAPVSRISP